MTRNKLLFNAAMALVQAARFVKPVDPDFMKILLDKAEYYKNQIVIDEKIEAEVTEFERRIKEGL
jgi:hypothetical protein